MMTKAEQDILKVLMADEKKWTWMTLDRMLSIRGLGGVGQVPRYVAKLAEDGMINIVEGNKPAMPFYVITPKGRAIVERLISQSGDSVSQSD